MYLVSTVVHCICQCVRKHARECADEDTIGELNTPMIEEQRAIPRRRRISLYVREMLTGSRDASDPQKSASSSADSSVLTANPSTPGTPARPSGASVCYFTTLRCTSRTLHILLSLAYCPTCYRTFLNLLLCVLLNIDFLNSPTRKLHRFC